MHRHGASDQDVTDPEERGEVIEAQAAAWVVRLEAGTLDETEQRAFDAWLRKSEAHAAAFAFARRTWTDLGRSRAARRRATKASQQPLAHRAAQPVLLHPRPSSRRWFGRSLAALLVLAAGLGAFHAGDPVTALRADYRTAPGETETVTLPDGSTVQLNSDSAIALRFDSNRRQVELLTGEAAFTVAKVEDSNRRPFVVQTAGGEARALGTRFLVHRQDGAVDVTVLQHRVKVSLEGDSTGARDTVVLRANQAVRYRRGSGLGPVRSIDAERAAAWLRGRLVFDRVPLAEAVAELNRYRPGRIVILDSELARRQVSGVFRVNDLDTAVGLIATELGARTATVPPLVTVLY